MAGVIGGSLAAAQRFQKWSSVSNPAVGIPNSVASQIRGAIVVSSHCSRSLASSAPHRLPVASGLLAADPVNLAVPVARRHEDEGALRTFLCGERVETRPVVVFRLWTGTLVDAELPTGLAFLHPRRGRFCFDPPVPTVTLGVVVTGNVYAEQLASGRVDQPAQEDGQMFSRPDVLRRPTRDLRRLDCQKVRRVRANRHGSILDTPALLIGLCLKLK